MRVSPAICNRVVDAARGVLNQFVSDIYIYTDHCKGAQSGKYVHFISKFRISCGLHSVISTYLTVFTVLRPGSDAVLHMSQIKFELRPTQINKSSLN